VTTCPESMRKRNPPAAWLAWVVAIPASRPKALETKARRFTVPSHFNVNTAPAVRPVCAAETSRGSGGRRAMTLIVMGRLSDWWLDRNCQQMPVAETLSGISDASGCLCANAKATRSSFDVCQADAHLITTFTAA
jgi:hypothetical protein